MDDHSTPQTVKDPQEMIAGMSPVMQPGLFVFCSILYNADSREAMAQAHGMITGAVLAPVATALANHNSPANVVAGTMHDHIFVPSRQADAAIEVLRALQKEAQAKLR